jgi:hypothetical protein
MMGLLSWFKIGKSVVANSDDVVSNIASGIDKLKLTSEERVDYVKDGAKLHLDFIKQNNDQNSERSKARREIAKAIVYYQLFMATLIGGIYKWDKEWAMFLMKLNVEMKIALAFASVIFFYFGYYGLQKIAEKVKSK